MYTFDQITNIHILFALWPSETINEKHVISAHTHAHASGSL